MERKDPNPKRKKTVQFCPKCGSLNIRPAASNLGDPFAIQSMIGWECGDCGHVGVDFFTVPEEDYERIKKKLIKR